MQYFLTPTWTTMSAYPCGGWQIAVVSWKFANPVTVENGDGSLDTIKSDKLVENALYVGFGVSPLQTKWMFLSGEIIGGVRLYHENTWEGLHNDLFNEVGFVELRIMGGAQF